MLDKRKTQKTPQHIEQKVHVNTQLDLLYFAETIILYLISKELWRKRLKEIQLILEEHTLHKINIRIYFGARMVEEIPD